MSNNALLLGATGGCGSQVLVRLLERGVATTVIVRSEDRLPAAARGHALLTVVTAPEGHLALSEDALREHCAPRLAYFKVPRYFRFIDGADIPMTVSGKVQKHILRELSVAALGL